MRDIYDLARRIRLGEDSTLELKEVLQSGHRVIEPKRGDLADELAGMANGRGGTVVLGVKDEGHEVVGIPADRLDSVEGWAREICNDSVTPPLDAFIRKIEMPGSSGNLVLVLRVDISRSLFVHRSPGGYFRRIGSSNRQMSPEVLARLFQERSQSRVIRFDESVVPGTSWKDVDNELARRFLREDTEVTVDVLRKLRIVADDDGIDRITVAGVLMCSHAPERWLPHSGLQAVSYAGERPDVNYQIDARNFGGPLDTQVFEAIHFLRRNMAVVGRKETARVELPQFSQRAIFEALVNAVAHRDYSMSGARIRFHLFRDRIELYVPGNLANTLTTDSMHLRQYSRNELVVSLLARCPAIATEDIGRSHLMDRRGDGVPIILAESLRLSGRAPQYTVIDDSELRLVIWGAFSRE